MARIGISYQAVATAAEKLAQQNHEVTIERIRTLTKTGSNSTIAKHLKQWRKGQGGVDHNHSYDKVPEHLAQTVLELWQQVMSHADAKVTGLQEELEKTLAKLREQLSQSHQANLKLRQENLSLVSKCDELQKSNTMLENRQRELEDKTIKHKSSIEKLIQQVADKEIRLVELSKLHQQTQANLEHYRETVRQERHTEQERHSKREHALEFRYQQHNQQLMKLQEEHNKLSQFNILLQKEKSTIENTLQQLMIENKELKNKHAENQKLIAVRETAAEYLQQQYQELQNNIKSQNLKLERSHTEYILASQKLSRAEADIKLLNQQISKLTREKWQLGQDKAELVGHLKRDVALAKE